MKKALLYSLLLVIFLVVPTYASILPSKSGYYVIYTGKDISYTPYLKNFIRLANGDWFFVIRYSNGYGSFIVCEDITVNNTCREVYYTSMPNQRYIIADLTNSSIENDTVIVLRGPASTGRQYLYWYYNSGLNYTNWVVKNWYPSNPYFSALANKRLIRHGYVTYFPSDTFYAGPVFAFWDDYNNRIYVARLYNNFNSVAYYSYFSPVTTPNALDYDISEMIHLDNTYELWLFMYKNLLEMAKDGYYTHETRFQSILSINIETYYRYPRLNAYYDNSGHINTIVGVLLGDNNTDSKYDIGLLVYRKPWGSITSSTSYITKIITDNTISFTNIYQPYFIDENNFIIQAYGNDGVWYLYVCNINDIDKTIKCSDKIKTSDYGDSFYYSDINYYYYVDKDRILDFIYATVYKNNNKIYLKIKIYKYDTKLTVKNENTLEAEPFKFNVYTSSKVYSLNTNVTAYISKQINIYSNETATVNIYNDNAPSRYYYIKQDKLTLDGYLLPYSDGVFYTFYVTDYNNNPILGAIVTATYYDSQKGAYVTVAQSKTNPDGSASLFLKPGRYYKIKVEYNGEVKLYFDYIPDPNIRTIVLRISTGTVGTTTEPTGGAISIEFKTLFDDVSYLIYPSDYYHKDNFTVRYIISSQNGTLEYYYMNITRYYNFTYTNYYYNYISNSPNGGELNKTIIGEGLYYVKTCFKSTNYTEYCNAREYYLYNATGLGGIDISSTIPLKTYTLFVIFVTLVVVAFFSRIIGIGAGLIGLVVLALLILLYPGFNIAGVDGEYILIAVGILVLLLMGIRIFY